MADVRLEDVSKVFKDAVAVDGVDLEIQGGEFFSLLGPSGCGKTTTLRMIGGFEEPTSGRVFLGGADVTDLPPHKRGVNTVFQSYALFPHLNVYENVAYGLKRKKVAGPEVTERVGKMLELMDLTGYEKRKKNQLSGGQQQRVALARALVNQPEVLLLDEPLGALDLKLRKQMQVELKRIQQEVGITFLYVTHDQEEAMTMSDRIGVMNKGRLEQVGAPEDVYEVPATSFVASFLGASNQLAGDVEGVSGDVGKVRLRSGEVIQVPASRLPVTSGPVSVGVRPEKLQIVREADSPPYSNTVSATVVVSAYTGVATSYICRTGSGEEIDIYVQNVSGSGEAVGSGASVRLSWDPRHTFGVIGDAGSASKEEGVVS